MAETLKPHEAAILKQIAEAKSKEATAITAQRIKNEQELERVRAESRAETNALVHRAVYGLGIGKAKVSRLGLGAGTDRTQIYQRLREVEPGTASSGIDEPIESNDFTGALKVEPGDAEGVTLVTLEHFSHEDLGTNLSVTVRFDSEGEGVLLAADIDTTATIEGNPLWMLKLWSLPEVQGAL